MARGVSSTCSSPSARASSRNVGDVLIGVGAQLHAGLLRADDRAVVDVGEVHHLAHAGSRAGTSACGAGRRRRRTCGSCRCGRARRRSGRRCTCGRCCPAPGANVLLAAGQGVVEAHRCESGRRQRARSCASRRAGARTTTISSCAGRGAEPDVAAAPAVGRPARRARRCSCAGQLRRSAGVGDSRRGRAPAGPARSSMRSTRRLAGHVEREEKVLIGHDARFYSERRSNSTRARRQSASIWALQQRPATRTRARRAAAGRSRRGSTAPYRSAIQVEDVGLDHGAARTASTVGRVPMLVTDG